MDSDIQGAFRGWKKLRDGTICELEIPANAERYIASSGIGRAKFAMVIDGNGVSEFGALPYRVGEIVRATGCGIYFYLERERAENHVF